MMKRKPNILVTGAPGVGKTTLIAHVVRALPPRRAVGFLTHEIREEGTRRGFALESLTGVRSTLAHVDIQSRLRVGKYGVDVPSFEDYLDNVGFEDPDAGIVVIDEIGKMECLSSKFRRLALEILADDRPLIATIALHGGGLIADIKARADVHLITLTRANRDALLPGLLALIPPRA
jgi:nucleoside-triphosphatase